jgi:hypothetical protein
MYRTFPPPFSRPPEAREIRTRHEGCWKLWGNRAREFEPDRACLSATEAVRTALQADAHSCVISKLRSNPRFGANAVLLERTLAFEMALIMSVLNVTDCFNHADSFQRGVSPMNIPRWSVRISCWRFQSEHDGLNGTAISYLQ